MTLIICKENLMSKKVKILISLATLFLILYYVGIFSLKTLSNQERDGYFEVTKNVCENTYDVRLYYYSKIFKHNRIFDVYVNTEKLPQTVSSLVWGDHGSHDGRINTSSDFVEGEKIENVYYTLKIKTYLWEAFKKDGFLYYVYFLLILFIYNNRRKISQINFEDKKFIIFLKKYNKNSIHIVIFSLLNMLVLFFGVQTIIETPNRTDRPEEILATGLLFNEAYEKDDYLYEYNETRENVAPYLTPMKGYDTYGEHHQYNNAYRAVRTGQPFSSMGYNGGFPEKEHNNTGNEDLVYSSLYLSGFNNTAELAYGLMPNKLMDTQEKEIENSKKVTLIRYVFGFIHILGYVLLFIVILKYLGSVTAWVLGIALILYPITLVGGITSYGFSNSLLIYLALALLIYPRLLKSFTVLKFLAFTLVMWFFGVLLSWPCGYIGFTIYTWAPTIVALFLVELYRLYYDAEKDLKKVLRIILRISFFAFITLTSSFIVFYFELKQASQWTGESINIFSYFFTRQNDLTANIDSFSEYVSYIITALRIYFTSPMFAPHLWMYKACPWFLMFIPSYLCKLPFILGVAFVFFISFVFFKKHQNNKPFKDLLHLLMMTVVCYFIYFFAIMFLFPRMMYHYHMFTGNLMIYQVIILSLYVGRLFNIWLNLKRKGTLSDKF